MLVEGARRGAEEDEEGLGKKQLKKVFFSSEGLLRECSFQMFYVAKWC